MLNDRPYTSEGGNSVVKFLWNVLFVILYPVITTFSLVFMGVLYVFSGLSKLVSKISANTESGIEIKKPTWAPFTTTGIYEIESLFVDEIMFGPAYYKFRASPAIPDFENRLFGDFMHPFGGGILLQQWNTTNVAEVPDFQLVFLNNQTGAIKALHQIKSFSWNLISEKEDELVIKWFTGTEGGEVVVHVSDLEEKIEQER